MVRIADIHQPTVPTIFELYGVPRLIVGQKEITADVPVWANSYQLSYALGDVCPLLIGPVIDKKTRRLLSSYMINLNGRQFLGVDKVDIHPSDRLLIFSSDVGG